VKAAKGRRATKVRFAVTATDAVDGVVPFTCKPPSGTRSASAERA